MTRFSGFHHGAGSSPGCGHCRGRGLARAIDGAGSGYRAQCQLALGPRLSATWRWVCPSRGGSVPGVGAGSRTLCHFFFLAQGSPHGSVSIDGAASRIEAAVVSIEWCGVPRNAVTDHAVEKRVWSTPEPKRLYLLCQNGMSARAKRAEGNIIFIIQI